MENFNYQYDTVYKLYNFQLIANVHHHISRYVPVCGTKHLRDDSL